MKIKNKFITAFILVVVIPVLIVSFILYFEAKNYIETDRLAELNLKVDSIATNITDGINNLKLDLNIFRNATLLRSNLQILSKHINDRDNPSFIKSTAIIDNSLYKSFVKEKKILDLILIDTEGRIVYSASERHNVMELGKLVPMWSEENSIKWRKGIWGSDIFKYDNKYEIVLVSPVLDNDNKLEGFLAFEVDIETINKIFYNKSTLGETGECLLGMKEENSIIFLSPMRYNDKSQIDHRIPLNSYKAVPMSNAVQGIDGSALALDYRGKNALAAWRYIPLLKAGLVIKMDEAEAFYPAYYLRKIMLIFTVILVLSSLFIANFISKLLTIPINELLKGAKAIGKGNFEFKPKIIYNDEFGILAKTIEDMALDLSKNTTSLVKFENEIGERRKQEQELKLTQEATLNILEDLNESTSVLKQERDKAQKYFETASVFMIIINPNERIEVVNEKGCEILGYSKEDIEGKNWFDTCIPERLRSDVRSIFHRLIKGEESYSGSHENLITTRDGSEKLILWHNSTLMDGENIVSIISSGEDITQRKEQEQRVKKSNELQQLLLLHDTLKNKLKLITDGIINIFDADFARIWLIKPGDQCSTGCPHATITEGNHACYFRNKCLHLVSSSGRYTSTVGGMHARVPLGCYKIGRLAEGEEPSFLTNDVVNDLRIHNHDWAKDLGLRSFMGVQLIDQSSKQPSGVMACFSKKAVSETEYRIFLSLSSTVIRVIYAAEVEEEIVKHRDHLEELVNERTAELKIARDQAQESTRAKSIFLANMSHEIRTPMNAIIGFSDLLYSSMHDEKQRSQLNVIRNASKNLLTIINDILDLSKIEAGKMKLQYAPVNILMLLKGIQEMFGDRAREKDISFEIDAHKDLPQTLIIDETRIRQILFNLIGNAIKFTDKGSVTVTVREKYKGDNKIDLIFAVKDTGVGISEEQQSLIFDEFQQQPGQKTGKYGGTGLGLAISKRLTEIMGGKISVLSSPGKGSVFTVYFSDVTVNKDKFIISEDSYLDAFDTHFSKAVILVADDNADDRKLLIDFFENSSVKIIEASNGLEAVEMARKHLPDVIFMDLKMPEMDGHKAARIIKEDELTKSIPVIALSAEVSIDENNPINLKLFDCFLAKPLLISNLTETLKKFLKYKIGSETHPPEKDKVANVIKDTTEDEKKLASELTNILENKFLPVYYDISKKQVFDLTQKFGHDLLDLAKSMSSGMLTSFAHDLCVHADNFDIGKLSNTLKIFPVIILRIKALANGEASKE